MDLYPGSWQVSGKDCTRIWRARLYLHEKLLADLPAPSAAAGKSIIREKFKQITYIKLWDEL
jgi:hypothetical protein